jgi:hypothetical protein
MHARDCTVLQPLKIFPHRYVVLENTSEFVWKNTIIESGAPSQVNLDTVLLFDKELTSCRACAD